MSRLTRVDIGERARMLRVTDDAIFDYPWLYAVEVGRWYLDEAEAARLREYLDRGGFLMDLGDACEHADDPRYPEPMTNLAYRFAVN